jgi:hypothetical protein
MLAMKKAGLKNIDMAVVFCGILSAIEAKSESEVDRFAEAMLRAFLMLRCKQP